MPRRHVAGHHREVVGDLAVGDRDAHDGRHRERARQPGDDVDGDAGVAARLDLLETTAEDEAVAALEADDTLAREGALDDQPVDLLLPRGSPARQLGDVDHLGGRRKVAEQLSRGEPVGDDHVGLHQRLASRHGDQLGVSGAAPDQGDPRHRGPAFAGGDRALVEPGHDRVADGRRASRLPAAQHGDGEAVVPSGGGSPGRRTRAVVGTDAEDPTDLGGLAYLLVDGGVVGGGDDVPGVGQVVAREAALHPGDLSGQHLPLDRRGDPGRHDDDVRSGGQQAGYPTLGDLTATNDDDPATGEPQARGVRRWVVHAFHDPGAGGGPGWSPTPRDSGGLVTGAERPPRPAEQGERPPRPAGAGRAPSSTSGSGASVLLDQRERGERPPRPAGAGRGPSSTSGAAQSALLDQRNGASALLDRRSRASALLDQRSPPRPAGAG